MTLTATEQLSTAITNRVREVVGVSTVYSTRPVAHGIRSAVVGVLGGPSPDLTLVTVTHRDLAVEVRVCIGVTPHEPAPRVCRRVYDAVDELLIEQDESLTRLIDVTVGSVH